MRHFTKAAAAVAVVAAGSASSALAADMTTGQIKQVRNIAAPINVGSDDSASRTGTALSYSAMTITGQAFVGAGGATIYADDILSNRPAGTRIDEISFSVVSFNTDGSYGAGTGTGGTVVADVFIGLFNADPLTGLPNFNAPKVQIPVTGIPIVAFTGSVVTVDTKALNIVKKDEMMWAAMFYTNVTGPANADGTPLIDNVGQFLGGAATKGFSDDFFYNGDTGGLSFFGGDPYANFAWEFRSVPTPGAMAIFGLAGLAATRRRR